MANRWIKFVLLASIICWATGAAQFVHELVEHGEHDEQAASVVSTPVDHQSPADGRSKHHDHDDCPTCQMLAHMSVTKTAPPPPLCAHLPTFYLLPLFDWRSPVVESHTFAPIRGPPTTGPTSL